MRLMDRLLKPLRRIRWIDDTLNFRDARRESDALHLRLQNAVAAAKKRGVPDAELQNIRGPANAEYELIWDPIYVRESAKLVQQARKHQIRIPPFPPNNDQGNEDWNLSFAIGDYILTTEGERRLKAQIIEAERRSYDEFRKWAGVMLAATGVILSAAAFTLALLSFGTKSKQPDPCPTNYYRSDSGECSFALQKSPPSTSPKPHEAPADQNARK